MFMLSKASVKSFSTSGGALARGDRIPRGIPVKSGFSQMVGGVRKRHLGEKSIGLFFVLTKKTEIYSIQYTLENDDLWTAARAQPPVWTTLRFKCWINKTCFHCFGFIINFYITGVLGWNPLSTWKGFWEKKRQPPLTRWGGLEPRRREKANLPVVEIPVVELLMDLDLWEIARMLRCCLSPRHGVRGCSGSRRCCWESGVQV